MYHLYNLGIYKGNYKATWRNWAQAKSITLEWILNSKFSVKCINEFTDLISLIAPWPEHDQSVKHLKSNTTILSTLPLRDVEYESLCHHYLVNMSHLVNSCKWLKYRSPWHHSRIGHLTVESRSDGRIWVIISRIKDYHILVTDAILTLVTICDVTEKWL